MTTRRSISDIYFGIKEIPGAEKLIKNGEIEEVEDPNGNPNPSAHLKMADRAKERHGYNPGDDAKAYDKK